MNSVRPNIFPTLVHFFVGWPYTLITNPPSKFWHMLPKPYAYTEMRALDTWLLDTWWLLFCHYSPIHTQTKQKHQQVWSVSGLLVLFFLILNYIFNSIWTRTKLMDRVTPELESERRSPTKDAEKWDYESRKLFTYFHANLRRSRSRKKENHIHLVWHLFTNCMNKIKRRRKKITC
jgi:hypothetical protein